MQNIFRGLPDSTYYLNAARDFTNAQNIDVKIWFPHVHKWYLQQVQSLEMWIGQREKTSGKTTKNKSRIERAED